MTPQFSIIVPIYNVELYLEECLDSLLAQTYPHWEAILVNDGSTDNSAAIAASYADKDHRFKIIAQPNQGLSAARNTGIRHAAGEYILFLDSDDWIRDQTIEHLKTIISDQNSPDIIHGEYRPYSDNDNISDNIKFPCFQPKPTGGLSYLTAFLAQKIEFPIMAWLHICRRDFLIDNNLYFMDGLLYEDNIWTPMILEKAQTVAHMGYDFYQYRIRPGSITTSAYSSKASDSYNQIVNWHNERLQHMPRTEAIVFAHLLWRIIVTIVIRSKNGNLSKPCRENIRRALQTLRMINSPYVSNNGLRIMSLGFGLFRLAYRLRQKLK